MMRKVVASLNIVRSISLNVLPSSSTNLIITPSCVKQINYLRNNRNIDLKLRISVNSGGCSGFQYEFNIDEDDLQVGDKIVGTEDIEVIVDEFSWEFIKGSTIDYDRGMMRSAFIVSNNPQSEAACGCGSSFAKKSFDINSAAH